MIRTGEWSRIDTDLIVWGNVMFCGNCVYAMGIGESGRDFARATTEITGRPAAYYDPDHGWVEARTGRVLRPCNYRGDTP